MEIIVKDACDADMPGAYAVMSSATSQLRRIYRPSFAAIARAMSTPGVRWLIALCDGQSVGALRYVAKSDALHFGMGVLPGFQRKGVGRALIEWLAREASAQGLPKLSLFTIKETGNVVIFEHLGFRVIRVEPAVDLESTMGLPLSDVYMERTLSADCGGAGSSSLE
jgi:GNAT superfamily N-acetyltransferase